MHEQGKVVRVKDGRAYIRLRSAPAEACKRCRACTFAADGDFVLAVPAKKDIKVGQEVVADIPTPSTWRSAMVVFGLPLAALVAGIAIGSNWAGLQRALGVSGEAGGLLLGAACGLALFIVALVVERRLCRSIRVFPSK